MKRFILFLIILSLFASCMPAREGFVRRQTTGSAYNKHGEYRERTSIPTLGR